MYRKPSVRSDEMSSYNNSSKSYQVQIPGSISDIQPLVDEDEAMAQSQTQLSRMPYVRVERQPVSNALRFRYRSETCSAAIPGASSTHWNRTYPSIKIFGCNGPIHILVSCVTKDKPYRPHPHKLMWRGNGDRGVFSVRTEITEKNNEYIFRDLRMQCVTRRGIAESLRTREKFRVDPFKTGFAHRNNLRPHDMKAVRLAFQVFLLRPDGKIHRALLPVVSDVIYDKKAISDLTIKHASHATGPACGGTPLILLCEKVTSGDVHVVFFGKDHDRVPWHVTVTQITVHKTTAILFKTPPYRNPNISEPVTVQYQLRRLSDNVLSDPRTFEYFPDKQAISSPGLDYMDRKIKKPLLPSLFTFDYTQGNKTRPPSNAAQDNWITNMQDNLVVPGPSHQHTFQEQNLPPMQPTTVQPHTWRMQSSSFYHHLLSPSTQMYPDASATMTSMQDYASSMDSSRDVTMASSKHGVVSDRALSMQNVASDRALSMQNVGSAMALSTHGVASDRALSMQNVASAITSSLLDEGTAMGQVVHCGGTPNGVLNNDYAQEAVPTVAADAAVTSSAEQLAMELLVKYEMTPKELFEMLSNMISSDLSRLSVNDS